MSESWNGHRTRVGDPLTARQEEVLAALRRYQVRHGVPPTLRELGVMIGVRNIHGVICHLRALVAKGRVKKAMENCARIYIPVVPEHCCPACGHPLEPIGEKS